MRTTVKEPSRDGFTLVEMLTVIVIIGILMSFILVVSFQGVQVARVRATQSLITKLSVALEDRLEALLSLPVTANGSHQWLASINPSNYPAAFVPWGLTSDQRASVIARLDQIKAEFPDVFFLTGNANYPINFCGLPFNPSNATTANGKPTDAYVLPLGNSVYPGFTPSGGPPGATGYSAAQLDPDNDGNPNIGPGNYYPPSNNPSLPSINPVGTGIFGASYTAAAALYRLAGYTTNGTDAVDNNGNGLVDEYAEGAFDSNGNQDQAVLLSFPRFQANHLHKTARAEMLYALLVNGQGPLGSSFGREDFTSNEVQDTDNDGVPEFVDAWGEPLLFYRWPAYHNSAQFYGVNNSSGQQIFNTTGLQKGLEYYMGGSSEPRQFNPLDPDRQLTALAWWTSPTNFSAMSPKAQAVQNFFMPLQEDIPSWTLAHTNDPTPVSTPGVGNYWERLYTAGSTSVPSERAYFVKFLISSAGPGLEPGYYVTPDSVIKSATNPDTISTLILRGDPVNGIPAESLAPFYFDPAKETDPPGLDDIDNQNIQSRSGGFQ